MVATRGQKQALAAMSNPLRDAGLLQQVFSFLPGHYVFIGAVCREWKAVYAGMEDFQVRSLTSYVYTEVMNCDRNTTLYSAAVTSPAAAELARECGLRMHSNESLQLVAGQQADLATLIALRSMGIPLSKIVVQGVALSGRSNILQRLVTGQQCPTPGALGYYAARSGNISMLNWLRTEEVCEFDHYTCIGAAEGGHLAALKYLRSEGCVWNAEYIACDAAVGGSIEVVEWLRQQPGIHMNADVMAAAAGTGRVAMCQYLRSVGCEWNASVCNAAAAYGEVNMLRWLRERGCPCDVGEVCTTAARFGVSRIFDYVLEQGDVLSAELLTEALNCAGVHSHLQSAQWLRAHGAQWPAVLGDDDDYPTQWSGESLAWARAQGCTSPVIL
jgi:hypothetical protein